MLMGRKLGGRELFKQRQAAKRLQSFNKLWKPGDKLRVLYPIIFDEELGEYDLLCGAIWGYPWDCKASSLKRVFIPTTCEVDEYGCVTTKDLIGQAVPLLRLVFDGQKRKAKAEIDANKRMSESARTSAKEQIDKDFEKKQPLARGLEFKVFTECFVIPLTADDKPDWKNATMASQDLSNKRYNAIVDAINNKANYHRDGATWFEISYAFKNDADKTTAGDVTPLGCPKDIAISYADETDSVRMEYAKKCEDFARQLPEDSDLIIKRNSNSKPVPDPEIMRAISDYCATNYTAVDALDGDDVLMDRLEKQLEGLRLFNVPVTIPSIVEKLDALDAEEAKKKKEAEEKGESGAPTIDDIQKEITYSKEEVEQIKENSTDDLGDQTEAAGMEIQASTDVSNAGVTDL